MILLKRGSALLAALLLIFHLVTYPVRAASVILPAAGLALTVTAFLNLAGIYPFDTESSFGDWSEGGLADLIQRYNDTNPAIQLNGETLHAYLYGGTAILTHNTYVALRNFVQWLKDTFSLTDNQEGVEIGSASLQKIVYGAKNVVPEGALHASYYGYDYFVWGTEDGVYPFVSPVSAGSATYRIWALRISPRPSYDSGLYWSRVDLPISGSILLNFNSSASFVSDDYVVSCSNLSFSFSQVSDFPVFESYLDAIASLDAGAVGVTADTSTVSVPPELPAEQEYIGLAISPGTVSGADTPATAMTPQAVERIIQQGVTERERPVVTTTEVEIAPGVDVDGTTGAVTENPVVITPDTAIEEIVPSVSELTAPQTFLDSLATTMQTKFPFCLPFDIMRLASAFRAEPVAPVIALTFHDPFTDEDYSIRVDLSPWDGVAQVVRSLETAVLFVGFWLNFDKFNVISMIFGQLG